MKKVNLLVKIGCIFCIFFQILLSFFIIFLSSKVTIFQILNYRIYHINIFNKVYIYQLENNLLNDNLVTILFSIFIFFVSISISAYVRLFKAKSNKLTKIFLGLYGIIWGVLPGIMILFGSYKRPNYFYFG
jgi:hypothetical protein